MASGFLVLEGLVKRFEGVPAVDEVSLALARGEILALLGPSGSGKTTTLRLLAGFEVPDAGRIRVDGEDVTGATPVARRFGMVFQHYALFPHMDVGANVAFGLESRGVGGAELTRRVAEALALVDLAGFERRQVTQLSGGQQQRVALARALAPEPRVLLLDEPLSNLDPALRERTRRELRSVIRRVGITTVIVTHEQEEAFDLGDRIAVLRGGRLEQVGTADALYAAPASAFVAGFVGRASAVDVEVMRADAGGDAATVRVAGAEWTVPTRGRPLAPGGAARLVVRPEAIRLGPPTAAAGVLAATVGDRRFLGATCLYRVVADDGTVLEVEAPTGAVEPGARVGLTPEGAGLHLYPGGEA